jgi:hypothetical protein
VPVERFPSVSEEEVPVGPEALLQPIMTNTRSNNGSQMGAGIFMTQQSKVDSPSFGSDHKRLPLAGWRWAGSVSFALDKGAPYWGMGTLISSFSPTLRMSSRWVGWNVAGAGMAFRF